MIKYDREFKDAEELCYFILIDCAGLEGENIGFFIHAYIDESKVDLTIFCDFDMLYVYYLDQLLGKLFKKKITTLYFSRNCKHIYNSNLLRKLENLEDISFSSDLDSIPELPDIIKNIWYDEKKYVIRNNFSLRKKEFLNVLPTERYFLEEDMFRPGDKIVFMGDFDSFISKYYDSKRQLLDDITK